MKISTLLHIVPLLLASTAAASKTLLQNKQQDKDGFLLQSDHKLDGIDGEFHKHYQKEFHPTVEEIRSWRLHHQYHPKSYDPTEEEIFEWKLTHMKKQPFPELEVVMDLQPGTYIYSPICII